LSVTLATSLSHRDPLISPSAHLTCQAVFVKLYLINKVMIQMMFLLLLTGQTKAKANKGPVDNASSHCQPKVGITTNARATSKHAPNAQKHCNTK
jgi:hypothetical protein